MKPKHKFLLIACSIFFLCITILLGCACYLMSLVFSHTPLPAYKYEVSQENLLTASEKISEHYNRLITPPADTEEIELTRPEVKVMMLLSSKYITNTINVKCNNNKNAFSLYMTGQKYHIRLSYYLNNILPFGNYINISATLNFSIKDHKNNIRILAAKCGDLNIPLSIAQEKAETYINSDLQGNVHVLKIIKSLNWHDDKLKIIYYPKEILDLIIKYQTIINAENESDPEQLPLKAEPTGGESDEKPRP